MVLIDRHHLSSMPAPSPRVCARIRCTYPDADLEPTEVTFEPGPELGRTPEEIHARILRLGHSALQTTMRYTHLAPKDAGSASSAAFWRPCGESRGVIGSRRRAPGSTELRKARGILSPGNA